MAEFHDRACDVLGVSTDTVETHQRWLTTPPAQGGLGPIQFPLASDADGAVCKQFGVNVLRQMDRFDAASYVADVPELFADILHESLTAKAADRTITMAEIAQRLASVVTALQ